MIAIIKNLTKVISLIYYKSHMLALLKTILALHLAPFLKPILLFTGHVFKGKDESIAHRERLNFKPYMSTLPEFLKMHAKGHGWLVAILLISWVYFPL